VASHLLGLRFRIPPGTWIFVSHVWCVFYRYTFVLRADSSSRRVLRLVCGCVVCGVCVCVCGVCVGGVCVWVVCVCV